MRKELLRIALAAAVSFASFLTVANAVSENNKPIFESEAWTRYQAIVTQTVTGIDRSGDNQFGDVMGPDEIGKFCADLILQLNFYRQKYNVGAPRGSYSQLNEDVMLPALYRDAVSFKKNPYSLFQSNQLSRELDTFYGEELMANHGNQNSRLEELGALSKKLDSHFSEFSFLIDFQFSHMVEQQYEQALKSETTK